MEHYKYIYLDKGSLRLQTHLLGISFYFSFILHALNTCGTPTAEFYRFWGSYTTIDIGYKC